MVTAVVAASAALVACGLTLLFVQRSRRDAERRLGVVLDHIDTHLAAVSASVESAVGRIVEAQSRPGSQPSLDLGELVETIAAEAASRTGADAVVLRLDGPDGVPVVGTTGDGASLELLEGTLASPGNGRFRAATIHWTYDRPDEPGACFSAAVVAPTGSATGLPGVLAAYSKTPDAFRPEHGAALHELLAEYRNAIGNARRFADVEARLRPARALRAVDDRRYEAELERQVARAHDSGRPLSVVVVGFADGTGTTTTESVSSHLDRLAQVVTTVTRRGDIPCPRGDNELAILLPGTSSSGAAVLTSRLRAEVPRSLPGSSIKVGHVERGPDETARELGARLGVLLASRHAGSLPTLPDRGDEALRRDVLETLVREVASARRREQRLAVVVLELDGQGRESEAALESFVQQLVEGVGSGSLHRLGPVRFALVLPAADVDRAETLVDSLDVLGHGLAISAGITELVEQDDVDSLLGRAEHALWQARQAGEGTIVVAVPGRRTPPAD